MPHLDEGALWVRATMPYTISFDEASKLGPQVREILRTFPQVTTVANELGRPDDGTDPIGFFNDEYFVGLKPYSDPAWNGVDSHEARADCRDPAEAAGVSRHHLQLHPAGRRRGRRGRDRPEELAGGEDLRCGSERRSNRKPRRCSAPFRPVPGITNITVVRELGQPSLTIEPDRAKIARYGLNVADVNTLIETAVGGTPATQVIQGERSFDLVVRLQEPYPREHGRDQEPPDRHAGRPAPAAQPVRRRSR